MAGFMSWEFLFISTLEFECEALLRAWLTKAAIEKCEYWLTLSQPCYHDKFHMIKWKALSASGLFKEAIKSFDCALNFSAGNIEAIEWLIKALREVNDLKRLALIEKKHANMLNAINSGEILDEYLTK